MRHGGCQSLGVVATVFRIRWFLTVRFLEVAVRIVLLTAIFARSGGRRAAARAIRVRSSESRG
jgi:hypothetical protein